MSLIYDNPWLVSELINSAIAHESKFNKLGQNAAASRDYFTLTKKLADRLIENYGPGGNTAQEAYTHEVTADKEAPLTVPDMASFGNFLQFTATNGIKVGGQRVAYLPTERNPDPSKWWPVTAEQSEFMMETVDAEGHRQGRQADYYVNKDLLVKYIQYLLGQTNKMDEDTQRFAKTMLAARIQDINRVFRTKLTTDYKEELPEGTLVDNVPNPLDPEHWEASGQTPLTIKDIKSSEALGDWVEHWKVAVKKGNQIVSSNDPRNFKLCDIISALAQRAKGKLRTSASKAAADAYLRLIVQIGSQNSCDMSGVQTQQQPGAGGQGQPGDMATLQELIGEEVFDIDSIDLNKISMFADKYASWANRPDINALRDKIHASVSVANNLLAAPGIIQVTNISREEFRNLCKNGAAAKMLANALTTVVNYGGRIVLDLINVLKRNPAWGERAARNLLEQVSQGGPQQSNLSMLNQMANLT